MVFATETFLFSEWNSLISFKLIPVTCTDCHRRGEGCCEHCAKTCHKDHNVKSLGISTRCYCDCGNDLIMLHLFILLFLFICVFGAGMWITNAKWFQRYVSKHQEFTCINHLTDAKPAKWTTFVSPVLTTAMRLLWSLFFLLLSNQNAHCFHSFLYIYLLSLYAIYNCHANTLFEHDSLLSLLFLFLSLRVTHLHPVSRVAHTRCRMKSSSTLRVCVPQPRLCRAVRLWVLCVSSSSTNSLAQCPKASLLCSHRPILLLPSLLSPSDLPNISPLLLLLYCRRRF